jgi:hypothetical protein
MLLLVVVLVVFLVVVVVLVVFLVVVVVLVVFLVVVVKNLLHLLINKFLKLLRKIFIIKIIQILLRKEFYVKELVY